MPSVQHDSAQPRKVVWVLNPSCTVVPTVKLVRLGKLIQLDSIFSQFAIPVAGALQLWFFEETIRHCDNHHHHQSLNCKGRWSTTDDFTTSFLLFFSVLHCPLRLCELQACPFPDVVFPLLLLSALSSPPFHCALQDGFGQT